MEARLMDMAKISVNLELLKTCIETLQNIANLYREGDVPRKTAFSRIDFSNHKSKRNRFADMQCGKGFWGNKKGQIDENIDLSSIVTTIRRNHVR
ncbi:hypothetical protein DXN05_16205 [Deminuibacter soli]|uniref:Uncharacterized protein n=1 Tax=Deminuibacter soli TaxID=2291815 RepID=A0A3E1NGU9_9BACT|nr:hypothetical protein DXN05_16205 [Deminuibacter soli]